ncbi:MAG: hypothetical protein WD276_10185 [Actinomycetota bacterium]
MFNLDIARSLAEDRRREAENSRRAAEARREATAQKRARKDRKRAEREARRRLGHSPGGKVVVIPETDEVEERSPDREYARD